MNIHSISFYKWHSSLLKSLPKFQVFDAYHMEQNHNVSSDTVLRPSNDSGYLEICCLEIYVSIVLLVFILRMGIFIQVFIGSFSSFLNISSFEFIERFKPFTSKQTHTTTNNY